MIQQVISILCQYSKMWKPPLLIYWVNSQILQLVHFYVFQTRDFFISVEGGGVPEGLETPLDTPLNLAK